MKCGREALENAIKIIQNNYNNNGFSNDTLYNSKLCLLVCLICTILTQTLQLVLLLRIQISMIDRDAITLYLLPKQIRPFTTRSTV